MQNSLILASGSPRRRELLSLMGITYQICPADVDEHMNGAPDEVVMALSRRKALAVAERHSGCTVLGADTLVACRGEIMGKPQDQQDAMRMLMLLSGGENDVYTGVTVIDGKTGFIIPIKDVKALCEKMIWFIDNQAEIEPMGIESYNYCREKFEVSKVNKAMLEYLNI